MSLKIPVRAELSKTRQHVEAMRERKEKFLQQVALRVVSEDVATLVEAAAQNGACEVFFHMGVIKDIHRTKGEGEDIPLRLSRWAAEDPTTWGDFGEILGLDISTPQSYADAEVYLANHVYSSEGMAFRSAMDVLCKSYEAAGYTVAYDPSFGGYHISGW